MGKLFSLEIEKMVYGGRGMGRREGKIVFVPFTVPGDRVQVEVTKDKKNFSEAGLRVVEKPSPLRMEPFCRHFGECGGCHYQHISYPDQLNLKQEILKESLRLSGKEEGDTFLPVIPSPRDRGYRIRAQFKGDQDGGKQVFGFYSWGSHRLVEIAECPLLHPRVGEIFRALQRLSAKIYIRGADIQVSPDEEAGVLGLDVRGSGGPAAAETLARETRFIKGVVLKGNKVLSWGESDLCYRWPGISGSPGLTVRAGDDSFSQVNPFQNGNLMQKAVEWADLTGKEKILDLYCGSGNLSLPLAQRAMRVWGIDHNARAITDARKNAADNGLHNCRFIAASTKPGLEEVRKETDRVDLAVLDPPRAGARDLADLVLLNPRKILYVSCEPPTLARDLALLRTRGYELIRLQGLDMFPHTYHIEVIAELAKTCGHS